MDQHPIAREGVRIGAGADMDARRRTAVSERGRMADLRAAPGNHQQIVACDRETAEIGGDGQRAAANPGQNGIAIGAVSVVGEHDVDRRGSDRQIDARPIAERPIHRIGIVMDVVCGRRSGGERAYPDGRHRHADADGRVAPVDRRHRAYFSAVAAKARIWSGAVMPSVRPASVLPR